MPDFSQFMIYAGIFVSAAIEGEVVYVTAVVLSVLGRLNPVGVLIAGASGGSAGDQFFFYILRSRLAHWLDRFPSIAKRRDRIKDRIHRHASGLILSSRFLPGLRIAIPAACAYAGIRPIRFSLLNLASGFAWAGAIMALVRYLGPTSMHQLGIQAWWAPIVPAIFVIMFFRWLGRVGN